jgi:hypothetical protein
MNPRWHRIGQDEKVDAEAWKWTDVKPGDVVQSRGTIAYKMRDFIGRDDDTDVMQLHSAPVLIIARIPGIPGEEPPGDHVTFVCLSRHGIILVVQPEKTVSVSQP